jgi:hypothetical protein
MRNRLILSLLVLLFSFLKVTAQYYDTGQDPSSLRWLQIKTGRFTVIYPEKYAAGGQEYAKALEEAYSKLILLFPEKKINLPVIIHNYTVQSNGYVAWAPKRMELFPTPEQNGIPLAPEKQLAIHELAHVFQMESLNQSFTKCMSFLLGQQAIGIVSSLLPMWLMEGDAVFAESVLSPSGRGRTAAFQKQLKAVITDGSKKYKYDKILNGSFKDFIPNYYESGYQMVSWAMLNSDPQIWNKAFKYTGQQPFSLNPVNLSLSASAGLRKKTVWDGTYDNLKKIWTSEIAQNHSVNYDYINPEKRGKYINYYSPVYAGKDSIIAIKTSLTDPPSFVLINQELKTEKRIHTPGNLYPRFISYGKSKIVWVETQVDPRWENREYSIIKSLDLKTGIVTKLSRKTRYLSAAISPDGSMVAALENTIQNINNLVIIDAETSDVLFLQPTPANISLQHPQWSADGKKITFVFLGDDGEGINSFSIINKEWKTLIEPGRDDLQSLFTRNDSLFFVSSSSGTENLYLLTPDKKISSVTNSRFGATDVSPAGNKMLFGNYTSQGNDICVTPVVPLKSENLSSSGFLINQFKVKQPGLSDSIKNDYPTVPYRKYQHLFRFHSWMPFYADVDELSSDPTAIRPGVTLLTQNSLSTITSTIGYEYSSEKRNVFHTRVAWKGIYPVFETQLNYGTTPEIDKRWQNVNDPSDIRPGLSMLNTISLPLQFNSGKFSEFVRPSVQADYRNEYIYLKDKGTYDYGQTVITGRLYFSNYHVSAFRDIYPRWAQIMDFNYCFAPFDKTIYGSTISVKTAFYFPGFFPNNGIKIRLEAEKQQAKNYFYRFFSSFPRGYTNIISKEIRFFSTDYVFPLMYPDLNFGSLFYLKRIRTGLFYDYAEGPGSSMYQNSSEGLYPLYETTDKKSFSSFGIELTGDFHVLRIPYTISGGIQAAWKNINEPPVFGVLFNIDLLGMSIGKRKM